MRFIATILTITSLLFACSDPSELARVDKTKISKDQFDAYLAFKRIKADSTDEYNDQLTRYLDRKALAVAVEKTGLLDDTALNAEFDEFKTQMLISRYMEQYLDKAVDNVAIENYYNNNQQQFQTHQVHVAHIMFRTNKGMSDSERQAVLQRARDIYAQLSKGEDFAVLAKQWSEDRYSGEKGGDLGWISQGKMDPAFSKAAFALTENQFTDVVETGFGYHIIKLLEAPRTQTLPLGSVRGDIRYQLRNAAKQAEIEKLMKSVSIKRN
ncbi:peptidylprolyl isomerase [Gynuella sp.]|uniref:peptidylprolyl isomerase n=1 Tax=Gynuella sp. TaxID=2969146 RepID=UPI003D0B92A6